MKSNLKYLLTIGFLFIVCATAPAQSVEWVPMEKAQKLALENNKKVMIFAEAVWCGYCKKMKEKVFPKENVSDSLYKYFYPVRLDIESDAEVIFNGQKYTQQELSRKFRVYSTPTFIFLNSNGELIGYQPGYIPADIFANLLAYVGSDIYTSQKFKEYLKEK